MLFSLHRQAGWGSDYSEFVKENIIPWKVYSPGSTEYEWCVVMPSQSEYSSLKTALNNAWSNGIVCINAAGNNGGTYNKQNSQTDTSLSIDPAATPYNTIGISYGSNNVDSTNSTTTWYPFRSYGPHGVESNIDVAAGYNSEDYPGLDGYTNRGPGIDIVGLGANTYTAYQGSLYGSFRWGMFSGTSCATPTVVGKAACIMEEYFWYNGAWPTPDQTKGIIAIQSSEQKLVGSSLVEAVSPGLMFLAHKVHLCQMKYRSVTAKLQVVVAMVDTSIQN